MVSPGFGGDRRVDFVDAEGTEHHGGAMSAGCDGSLGRTVAEVDNRRRGRI
jgi:hypothetical protein